jgi:HEAT repeat protein
LKTQTQVACCFVAMIAAASGCSHEPQGPILAGGREVKSWIADLHDPKPQVRRVAVLKLGNAANSDPSVADALAEALRDSDTVVRRDAVLAVAKLSQPTEPIVSQLKTMSQSDGDSVIRDYATRALTRFGK